MDKKYSDFINLSDEQIIRANARAKENGTKQILVNRADFIDILKGFMEDFISYEQVITQMLSAKALSLTGNDRDEYRNIYAGLDRDRTAKHNKCIADVRIMNRICDYASLERVYDGEPSEDRDKRHDVALFVFDFIHQVCAES